MRGSIWQSARWKDGGVLDDLSRPGQKALAADQFGRPSNRDETTGPVSDRARQAGFSKVQFTLLHTRPLSGLFLHVPELLLFLFIS